MKKIMFLLVVVGCCFAQASSQPVMILVKGGTFMLGDSAGDADERPVHRVFLSDFYIAKTEVTLAQFGAFVEATNYRTDAELGEGSYIWDSLGWHKADGVHWRHNETGRLRLPEEHNFPVQHVSWYDAAHYCNWLSEKSGFEKVYHFGKDSLHDLNANGYRLPTEAEWEYAAGGGKAIKETKYAGEGSLDALAWYSGNASRHPHPVGLKNPNALGIHDLSGNVGEWCHDWYGKGTYSKNHDAQNPTGLESGGVKCLRGGAWNNSGKHCRIANRSSRYPDFRDGSVGFRVARRP